MANAFVGIDEPASIDKRLDTESLTVGAETVHRERVQVAGAADVEIAVVTDAAPASDAQALVTRNIPSGTQAVSDGGGSLTVDALNLDIRDLSSATDSVAVTDGGGTLSVDDGGGALTVDGSVSVSNFPAVQPVSDNGGALTVDGSVSLTPRATLKFAVVSEASANDNEVVAAMAGNKIKVVSYVLVADGTVAATWRSGTTPLTGAMALIVNSGVALAGSTDAWLFETAVNTALNLHLSAAVGVRGHIAYFEEA